MGHSRNDRINRSTEERMERRAKVKPYKRGKFEYNEEEYEDDV